MPSNFLNFPRLKAKCKLRKLCRFAKNKKGEARPLGITDQTAQGLQGVSPGLQRAYCIPNPEPGPQGSTEMRCYLAFPFKDYIFAFKFSFCLNEML